MLQANQNNSVLTVSPPDSGFSPRPEFARDSHVPSTFALLAIAGAGFVRASSFSSEVLQALRYAFQSQSLLRSIREDTKLRLVEFTLEGKPWTQSKNPDSEKLFIQVLAIIFRHGYRFLSTIDYGRESSERVTIAFSRPTELTAYEAARVPFGISFPSSRVLRVINPPLNSTPAILQAARSAWPRGVVSEKKVSSNCYEFRLKGYRWFQEDTFSTDSMQHILSLLNALDRFAFTLLTSISLTGSHSRVKDLWVFAGSPMEAPSGAGASTSNVELPAVLPPASGPKSSLSPVWANSPQGINYSADTLPGKSGSLPGSSQGSSHTLGHIRAATEPNATGTTRSASVLRKRSPEKTLQPLPFSQAPYSRSSEEFPLRRKHMSTINSVDMTGIGTGVFISTKSHDDVHLTSPRDFHRTSTGSDRERVKTGELFYDTGPGVGQNVQAFHLQNVLNDSRIPRSSSSSDSSSGSRPSSKPYTPRCSMEPPNDVPQSVHDRVVSDAPSLTPPILGSRVFRDSAFSSSSNRSVEVPITWTGAADVDKGKFPESLHKSKAMERDSSSPETDEGYGGSAESGVVSGKRSSTPKFPGGWQPSPIAEVSEDQGGLSAIAEMKAGVAREVSPERKAVDAERVASPTRSETPEAARKSEVAHVSVTKAAQRPMDEKSRPGKIASPPKPDGWVLVNVVDGTGDHPTSESSGERHTSPPASLDGRRAKSPDTLASSPTPLTKAIAAEDARDARAAREAAQKKSQTQSTSGLKRLFSSKNRLSTISDGDGRPRNLSLRERWLKKKPV